IAMAAIAAGADGVFMETHQNPAEAKSDGANMLPLSEMEKVLTKLSVMRLAYNEAEKI
ncbi:MAG: 3-deoxy-8-phosphooctulonate synthase, partial [Muribaculaceae bacterium]|nr:3-deoxy-8-phosphooctulonate synthase [Muribaculaceae bacterium]